MGGYLEKGSMKTFGKLAHYRPAPPLESSNSGKISLVSPCDLLLAVLPERTLRAGTHLVRSP